MEKKNRDIKLVRKKENKLVKLFENKNKRYLFLFLCVLPFLVAIGIFGFIIYRDAKDLLNTAKGDSTVVIKDENNIQSMNYVLRDNATDYQKEIFSELKSAVEVDGADDQTLASLVAKNFIADFYTWTNKQGQYDIGGFYYVLTGKDETTNYKETAYLAARDGFYKYLTYYINQYGSDKLLEVTNVEINSVKKLDYKYTIRKWINTIDLGNEMYDVIYEDVEYDAYLINCSWTYKEDTALNLNDFGTTENLIVVKDGNRFEVAEASVTSIDARPKNETEANNEQE